MERLIKYFTPERYQIDLKIEKAAKRLSGEEIITGVARGEVKLHSVGNEILDVRIGGKKVKYEVSDGILTLLEPREGACEIKVRWERSLNENMQGAYISQYTREIEGKEVAETMVSTQFESHYARECFPSVDEPEAKAVFRLAIEVDDPEDVVLANMPGEKVGKKWIFEDSPKMSTYLLAFVVGKFHSRTVKNKHGVKITSYCALNQSPEMLDFANEVAAKSLDYYDTKFGVKYPLSELKQVAIPDFEAGAMENWGLVTYRESCLLVDASGSVAEHKAVAITVAHELSHQWFGDLVTMKWWDDLWLNESFASVMEYMAVDAFYPEYQIWEDFFTGDCLAAWRRDALEGVQSVRQEVNDPAEIATLFDGAIVYAKGAHLMLMLIRLMGEKAFFAGLNKYFVQFAYSNTTGDDLWNVLTEFADFDVKEMMDAWISRPGYPVISGDGKQRRFLASGIVPEDAWPLPELADDMSGHYIINLSQEEFEDKLAQFEELSFEQKLRFVSDRIMLARTDEVPATDLIEVLRQFGGEESAALWELLMVAVADLKIFFDPGSTEEKKFKKFIRSVAAPQVKKFGLFPRKWDTQDTVLVRSDVLGLSYYGEDLAVLKELAMLLPDEFNVAQLKNISAEMRDDVLAAKLYLAEKKGDARMFERILELYRKVAEPGLKADLLGTLTLAKSEKAGKRLVRLLSEPEIVKPQDHLYLYLYLRRNPVTKAETLEWLFSHWDYLMEMTGEKSIEDYPRYTAATVRTREEAEKFYEFFADKAEMPVLKRSLKIARAEIEAKLALIESDRAGVYKALE